MENSSWINETAYTELERARNREGGLEQFLFVIGLFCVGFAAAQFTRNWNVSKYALTSHRHRVIYNI